MEPGIDVHHIAGDAPPEIAGQKDGCIGHLGRISVTAQRRDGGYSQHLRKTDDGTGRSGLDRTSRDGVDPYVQGSQVAREVADVRLQGGFCNPHYVVVLDYSDGAKIGQGDYGPAAGVLGGHERSRGAGDGEQRVGADVLSERVSGPRGFDEWAAQVLAIRKGNAVDD